MIAKRANKELRINEADKDTYLDKGYDIYELDNKGKIQPIEMANKDKEKNDKLTEENKKLKEELNKIKEKAEAKSDKK